MKEQFVAAGGGVSEQIYFSEIHFSSTSLRHRPYRNLIATFGPRTEEKIIVGAHYDACGPFPGADDNASGVSGLLVKTVRNAMRRASKLPVYSLKAPRFLAEVDWSDHRNYWAEGYPAVMLTDTAFYRNPYWHSPEDTADRLDYHRMAMVVQGLRAAVDALSTPPKKR